MLINSIRETVPFTPGQNQSRQNSQVSETIDFNIFDYAPDLQRVAYIGTNQYTKSNFIRDYVLINNESLHDIIDNNEHYFDYDELAYTDKQPKDLKYIAIGVLIPVGSSNIVVIDIDGVNGKDGFQRMRTELSGIFTTIESEMFIVKSSSNVLHDSYHVYIILKNKFNIYSYYERIHSHLRLMCKGFMKWTMNIGTQCIRISPKCQYTIKDGMMNCDILSDTIPVVKNYKEFK